MNEILFFNGKNFDSQVPYVKIVNINPSPPTPTRRTKGTQTSGFSVNSKKL